MKYILNDFGKPEYLDGVMSQFSIETIDDDIIAYTFDEDITIDIINYLNNKE